MKLDFTKKTILETLRDAEKPLSSRQLASKTKISVRVISANMWRLAKNGYVNELLRFGWVYEITEKGVKTVTP